MLAKHQSVAAEKIFDFILKENYFGHPSIYLQMNANRLLHL